MSSGLQRKRITRRKNLEKVRPFNLQDAFPKVSEFQHIGSAIVKNFPEEAEPVLEMISELYRIKYELSGEARQKEWGEIIDKLFSYLLEMAQRPKSVLQSAIAYTLNAPDRSVCTSILGCEKVLRYF